jgi:hypothetical protein
MYNRIAAYDYIVSQVSAHGRSASPAMSPSGRATPIQDIFAKPISRQGSYELESYGAHTEIAPGTILYPPSSTLPTSVPRFPRFLSTIAGWFHSQLPRLDPKDLLPVQIDASKVAITCGNPSTPNILVIEFGIADGVAGVVSVSHISTPKYRPL